MIRVLQVYPQLNNAGTEKVIFNLYENMNRSKVQFDFLLERKGELDEKVINMGGVVHYLNAKGNREYYSKLITFLKKHPEYEILHTHTHGRMGLVLKAAKNLGIKCRIAHSHNARNDLPKFIVFAKGIKSMPIEHNATHFFACSENAAKWLFPHQYKKCKIVYNGINLDNFLYDEDMRLKKRHELGINENEFVMIHVGRFAKQKNHEYLIDILQELNKDFNDEWKMLLVGVGPLQDKIRRMVEEENLKNHILFLGNRTDVNELLSASDMFLFPSLHEGLGIVVIEAQASGIPCVVSDAVPKEADFNIGLINTLSLSCGYKAWINEIKRNRSERKSRNDYKDEILNSNYNIRTVAKEMEKFYISQYSYKKD